MCLCLSVSFFSDDVGDDGDDGFASPFFVLGLAALSVQKPLFVGRGEE